MSESSLPVYAIEVLDEMVRYHIGEIIFYGMIGVGSGVAASLRSAHILHSGRLSGPTAVIQTTDYETAHIFNSKNGHHEIFKNPESGHAYRNQKIRTEEVPFQIGDVFDPAVRRNLVKKFNKAAKEATKKENSPFVFEHILQVLPEKDRQKTYEFICNSWQNYFSGLYRDTKGIISRRLKEDEVHETITLVPLLVSEEGAIGAQLRVLLLQMTEKDKLDLPEPKDVLFLLPDGSYGAGEDSLEKDRYDLLKSLNERLCDPDFVAFVKNFSIEIPTGKVTQLAQPTVIAPLSP